MHGLALRLPQHPKHACLLIGKSDGAIFAIFQRHPLKVLRERPMHGRCGIGRERITYAFGCRRLDKQDAAAVEVKGLLER